MLLKEREQCVYKAPGEVRVHVTSKKGKSRHKGKALQLGDLGNDVLAPNNRKF